MFFLLILGMPLPVFASGLILDLSFLLLFALCRINAYPFLSYLFLLVPFEFIDFFAFPFIKHFFQSWSRFLFL